jgi:serine protease inhibitor
VQCSNSQTLAAVTYICSIIRSILDVSEDGSNESLSKDIQRSSFGQKYFEVDHPFLFLVWDYYSGMLLLMGRVVNPLL